jgi:hypothetical protein
VVVKVVSKEEGVEDGGADKDRTIEFDIRNLRRHSGRKAHGTDHAWLHPHILHELGWLSPKT